MTPVYVPKDPHEKDMQRALIQYRDPKNYQLVKEALIKAGREDLIGFDSRCLILPRPMQHGFGKAPAQNRNVKGNNTKSNSVKNSRAGNKNAKSSDFKNGNVKNNNGRGNTKPVILSKGAGRNENAGKQTGLKKFDKANTGNRKHTSGNSGKHTQNNIRKKGSQSEKAHRRH